MPTPGDKLRVTPPNGIHAATPPPAPLLQPRAVSRESPVISHRFAFDHLPRLKTHITSSHRHKQLMGLHMGQRTSNLIRTGEITKTMYGHEVAESYAPLLVTFYHSTAALSARPRQPPYRRITSNHTQHSLGAPAPPRLAPPPPMPPPLGAPPPGQFGVVAPPSSSISKSASPPRPKRSPNPPLPRCEPPRFEDGCRLRPEVPTAGAVDGRRAATAAAVSSSASCWVVLSSHRKPCGLPPHAGLPLPL